jgi:pyruvate,orthophosphate dikinase
VSSYLPIYRISKDECTWGAVQEEAIAKKILGGKAASLVSMTAAGMNVPPAFTITTEVCNEYLNASSKDGFITGLMGGIDPHVAWLDSKFSHPPLVSVRSGAPISMPGMMDTILNVGLTTENITFWENRIGERAAWDSYRRLIQMMGATAFGIDMALFDGALAECKKVNGVTEDTDLTTDNLKLLVKAYKAIFTNITKQPFPDLFSEQLKAAVVAVFNSWNNPRAIEYRKINKIDGSMGTAVTVQAMVFGNMGEDCGTGVLFTRNPSTGENEVYGEFLTNAQGEDVVAGIRTPLNIHEMEKLGGAWVDTYSEIETICEKLEDAYRDMVDIEFTVQQGELFILQSRVGKRSAMAAFEIAVGLVNEGVIKKDEALSRLTRDQFKTVRRPMIDPSWSQKADVRGLPACPGVAVGVPVFSAAAAVASTVPCVLVTHETDPDDIAGMKAAVGIVTATGGATSHAAVVARAMDKPCVVGCTDLSMDAAKKAKKITLDGSTGKIWFDEDVPVVDSSSSTAVKTVMDWCMEAGGFVRQETMDMEVEGIPHRIMVAHWWGDNDVLEMLLDSLAERQDRHLITLDLRGPHELVPKSDLLLENCFGEEHGSIGKTIWGGYLDAQLSARKDLAGLTLIGSAMKSVDMLKCGYMTLGGEAKTVADLLSGHASTMSQDFVEKVLGGEQAKQTLLAMMEKQGIKLSTVQEAVPPDYAAFTVLAA